MFDKEKDMQAWLSKELETAEGLSELIAEFDDNTDGKSDAETKIINGYSHCYKSLHINEVISEDENISLKQGDILRPDFLLYAAETESVVVLELKNIANPTRQAGTELGAYASEIKSYLPFISDADIVNVVISREWPTLLRHYLFNEIFWLQRNILCLEPYIQGNETIKLRVLPPSKLVEDNVSLMLSERHLGGYQLCLYDDGLYTGGSRERLDNHIEQMRTAIAAMAIKGNAQNNHGFAFLWKDYRSFSLAPYSITILNFAPFQSLERFLHGPNDEPCDVSEITDRFIKLVGEYNPIGHGQSLEQLVDYGERYLESICSPRAEGFMHWDDLKRFMMESSELLEFHAWGVFSELLADRIAKEYESGNHSIKLTDPQLGLTLIDEVIDPGYNFIDLTWYNYDPEDESL